MISSPHIRPSPGWSFALQIIVILLLPCLMGCERKKDNSAPVNGLVKELLDMCSPFESWDDESLLDFYVDENGNQLVEYDEATDDEREDGILKAKNPKKITGSWSADETTKVVTVNIGQTTANYAMASPGGTCILVDGDYKSSNLEGSWFGSPDFSEPDKPSPSP